MINIRCFMSLSVLFNGFVTSLSLIMAIGAQNAFVLKQGLKKEYVLSICLICAFSDSLLILAGVFGFGKFISGHQQIMTYAQWGGATFLVVYGVHHFYQAFSTKKSMCLDHHTVVSWFKIILFCLAFTWLNPHVYLDTVVLVGAISTQFEDHLLSFAIGAITASWLFFFSLGFGAQYLSAYFHNPRAWQALDILIALIMWYIAYHLII